MAGATNYGANTSLSSFWITQGKYLGLHSTDPTNTGNPATEVNGGSYQRQPLAWLAPSNRTTANSNQLIFLNLPATTIAFMAVWDSLSSGNCLWVIPVSPSQTVNVGGTFIVPVNDLSITFP